MKADTRPYDGADTRILQLYTADDLSTTKTNMLFYPLKIDLKDYIKYKTLINETLKMNYAYHLMTNIVPDSQHHVTDLQSAERTLRILMHRALRRSLDDIVTKYQEITNEYLLLCPCQTSEQVHLLGRVRITLAATPGYEARIIDKQKKRGSRDTPFPLVSTINNNTVQSLIIPIPRDAEPIEATLARILQTAAALPTQATDTHQLKTPNKNKGARTDTQSRDRLTPRNPPRRQSPIRRTPSSTKPKPSTSFRGNRRSRSTDTRPPPLRKRSRSRSRSDDKQYNKYGPDNREVTAPTTAQTQQANPIPLILDTPTLTTPLDYPDFPELHISNQGVHNISGRILEDVEMKVLTLNFNFCPLPADTCNVDILEAVDEYAYNVRLRSHFYMNDDASLTTTNELRAKINKHIPFKIRKQKYQPTKADRYIEEYLQQAKEKTLTIIHEFKAQTKRYRQPHLQQGIQTILDRHNIILKPADKNYGPTIIDKQQYITAGEEILSDPTTYTLCTIPPNINIIIFKLKTILRTYKEIYHRKPQDQNETYTPLARALLASTTNKKWQYARLYLCPKIHKEKNHNEWLKKQWRQICASIGWVTYETSTYLDLLLQPIMRKIPTYLKDSATLIKELDSRKFPPQCYFLEADVDNMYPSINIQHALNALANYIQRQEHNLEISLNYILALAHWVLTNNYIEFNNKIYLQIKGTAIGTPFAVTFACIYMAEIEYQTTKILLYCRIKLPLYMKRYIDDKFGIFLRKIHAELYLEIFNSIAPGIHLTGNVTNTHAIFLDTKIHKNIRFENDNRLDTDLYQKLTNQYLFIPPNSYHQPKIFLSWITAYIRRIRLNCSDDELYIQHKRTFYNRLLARGYTEQFLQPIFERDLDRRRLIYNINKKKLANNQKDYHHC